MDILNWTTEQRRINDLVPYEANPRRLTEEMKARLIKSIEKFNLVEIPVINTDNVLIAGHQRLKVMQLLGRGDEMVDVRVPSRTLTDDEVKEYNVRSNISIGEWDLDILNTTFGELNLPDLGIDCKQELFIQSDTFGKQSDYFHKKQNKEEVVDDNPDVHYSIDTLIKEGDLFELQDVKRGGGITQVVMRRQYSCCEC